MKYTVKNIYGGGGSSHHKTPEAALKAASRREGLGWIVLDDQGNQWDWGHEEGIAVISRRAGE